MGIIIPIKISPIKNLYQIQPYGHHEFILNTGKTVRGKGFDLIKEEEAYKLAIAFNKNVRLNFKGYLKIILLIQHSTNNLDILKRVYNIFFIEVDKKIIIVGKKEKRFQKLIRKPLRIKMTNKRITRETAQITR